MAKRKKATSGGTAATLRARFEAASAKRTGGVSHAQMRESPAGWLQRIRWLVRDLGWDLSLRESLRGERTEFRRLAAACDGLDAQLADSGPPLDVAAAAADVGRRFAEWEFKRLAEGKQSLLDASRLGGESRRLSEDEVRKRLAEWDKKLEGKKRTKKTFTKLGIPSATYYETKKRLKDFDSGT